MTEPTVEDRVTALEETVGLLLQQLTGAEEGRPSIVATLKAQNVALMERLSRRGNE